MSEIFIKSSAICGSNPLLLENFGLKSEVIDKQLIPVALRRRTALTTRMAITVATKACNDAQIDTSKLASVFVSLGGEIQVTDALCRLLPDKKALLSPTQFHNSVHNTTAGYWGILNHCQSPSTAIAAMDDGFAMGLIEAGSQLQQATQDILLVCYDEIWPTYLAPPVGSCALACAFVLSKTQQDDEPFLSFPEIMPTQMLLEPHWCDLVKQAPAAAAIPLLQAIEQRKNKQIPLNIHATLWQTHLQF
ncbi:MAG: beta-ketoacyl synthase chain length factor [Methylococcales bacterium]|nr:beta-ketoacyl synthase chain length factor [Methylococcales bacterium]